MSYHVPANQTVSFSVWKPQVCDGFDHEFTKRHAARIELWFDTGETIDGARTMLRQFYNAEAAHNALDVNKRPRALAQRVVKF